ncbi:actin [Tritrichomonas foetus]|uniref:Actin n=1 Tax=Tritrichomonas foetus TaxID=1144522 RepID=A0A1J4KPB7_9EUKA|nr:actin [Tritrichomonas foetus]|eukprot:OHT11550.1 actin [Tritrichomonas foetus]
MRAKSNVIVIDLGACSCKAGFAGEDTPRSNFPTLVAKVKNYDPVLDDAGHDFVVGNMQNANVDIPSILCPFKNGLVSAKEDIEKLFTHIFENELHVDSEKRPIVLSEPLENTKETRSCFAEVLFETFHIPSIFMGSSPSLALYSSCETAGVVLDVGDSFAQVSSIYEWTQMPQTLIRTNLAGMTVSKYFQKCLKDTSYQFTSSNGTTFAKQLKEKLGFVSLDYQKTSQMEDDKKIEYQLGPDSNIKVGKERFMCPECLFQPSLVGMDCDSVATMVYESVMRSDIGLRDDLLKNIVISSGTTLMKGFEERLKKELTSLFEGRSFNLVASPKRLNSVWVGGSIVGSLALFSQMVVTREEFGEVGATALMRRFY